MELTPVGKEILLARDLTEASIVLAALFGEAERRLPPAKRIEVGMEYANLDTYVRALDPRRFGAILAQSSQPEHLLRMWAAKGVRELVLERVENTRFARFMLTPLGRQVARLAPLTQGA